MAEDDSEIAALLDNLAADDPDSLAALFVAHRERLWRMVHFRLDPRLVGRIDAEDVLQEAFIDAQHRISHFLEDPTRSFYIWLRLIVGQTLINVHRRHLGAKIRSAEHEVSLSGPAGPNATSVSIAGHLLAHMTSPSQAAMRAEAHEKLEEALAGMDSIDREVLVLRHFEELGNNEVADILGIKKSAASNRYIRALGRLRIAMEAIHDSPGE